MSTIDGKPTTAENRLVVFSSAEKKHCTKLLEGFGERHAHIEVEFRDGISVALHERYLAELAVGKNPDADVLWSSAMDLQMGLVQEIARTADKPRLKEIFGKQGARPVTSSSAELSRRVEDEIKVWKNVIAKAGVKLE